MINPSHFFDRKLDMDTEVIAGAGAADIAAARRLAPTGSRSCWARRRRGSARGPRLRMARYRGPKSTGHASWKWLGSLSNVAIRPGARSTATWASRERNRPRPNRPLPPGLGGRSACRGPEASLRSRRNGQPSAHSAADTGERDHLRHRPSQCASDFNRLRPRYRF